MESHRGVSSAAEPSIRVLVIVGRDGRGWESDGEDSLTVAESDPEAGLERLAAAPEEFDCVIVPGGPTASETIERVERAVPAIPVVHVVENESQGAGGALGTPATEVVQTDGPARMTDELARHVRTLADPGRSSLRPAGWIEGVTDLSRRVIAGSPLEDVVSSAVSVVHESIDPARCVVYSREEDGLRLVRGNDSPGDTDDDTTVAPDAHPELRDALAQDGPVISEVPGLPAVGGDAVHDIGAAVSVAIGPADDPFGVVVGYYPSHESIPSDAAGVIDVVGSLLADVVAQIERRAELERYGRIVETIDDGIYTLDDEFRITWVNQAAVTMLGYPREELVGSHALMLTSEETIEEAARISQELLNGERRVGRLDTVLRTADGERLPIETIFTMLPLGDGRYGQVGVFRDVTARKEYERVLTALHDSTRQLLRAESSQAVVQTIQGTSTELLDLSTVVYRFDSEANVLEPVVTSIAPGLRTEDIGPVGPKDGSPAWRAFVDQEAVTVDERPGVANGSPTAYFPLGPHGVFAASTNDGSEFDTEMNHLTNLLVANAEAALDRIDREEELRERERERQRQNRRLEQLNRINEIIRGIDQTLVQAETRGEIEQAVCDQLVTDDRCAFVWIGTTQPGRNEIIPRVWAGTETGYLDEVSITTTADAAEPAGRAANERQTVMVPNVSTGFQDDPWRTAALSHGYLSAVSVPLAYGDLFYGVLTVYADEPDAFDEVSEAVFGELGETIAYAINSLETKQSLLSDRSVELDLRITEDDELLLRLARAADCRLEFREFIPQRQGESTMVFASPVTAVDGVLGLQDQFVSIEGLRQVSDQNGTAVYEATVRTPTVARVIKQYGALLRSIIADEHELRAVVELPRGADVRAFVETLQRSVPATELVGRRNRDRSEKSGIEFRNDLEAALTDRQLEVLRSAYRNGYFEWPREQTGEEVATGLGISQPTFNRHLRESERKLFTLLFGDDQ